MQFTIWMNYDCNMECSYCYEGEEKKCMRLSLDDGMKILRYIRQISEEKTENININLHGGEPMLNYAVMKQMVEEIKSWNMNNVVLLTTTNGTLLSDERVNFLVNNFDEVSISIDGNRESHNLNRRYADGRETFDIVLDSARKLLIKDKSVIGRMTLTPETISSLEENITFLKEVGFNTIVPIVNQYDNRWSSASKETVVNQLKMVIDKYYQDKDDPFMVGMVEEIVYREKSRCMPGKVTMHFAPDAKIYPCAHVVGQKDFCIGNVITGLDESKLSQIYEINNDMAYTCPNCAWNDLCHGVRCKMINYAISKDYVPTYSSCLCEHILLEVYQYYKHQMEKIGRSISRL